MHQFEKYEERARRRHGDKFDSSKMYEADSYARQYFNSERVIVETTYRDGVTWRRAGRVSATTGWRPALMLMSTVRSVGSSDLLGENDKVVAVKTDRGYRDLRTGRIVKANLGWSEK